MHPVGVELAGWIQGSLGGRVGGYRMEAIVGVEWRYSIAHGDRVVVGELCHREKAYAVVLLVTDKCPEVCFNGLVEAFRLSVGLVVEGCRHPQPDARQPQEFLPCFVGESRISV